jgi:hypothetical protein
MRLFMRYDGIVRFKCIFSLLNQIKIIGIFIDIALVAFLWEFFGNYLGIL